MTLCHGRVAKRQNKMRLREHGIPGVVALGSGVVGGGTLLAAGGSYGVALAGTICLAVAGFAGLHALRWRASHNALVTAHRHLGEEIDNLRERQALYDAKIAEIERRTIESPALVWRAATADIEVMGSLINDLAKTVAEHNKRLNGQIPAAAQPAVSQPPAPAVTPETAGWFEDEAELGFTADGPCAADIPALLSAESIAAPLASAALVLELRTTLASALSSDRLELCLQPIVTLPQRKPRGYNASLRLKGENGDVQTDTDLRRIAVATGLQPELDKVLVERAIQVLRVLRARNKETVVCCAVAGHSLHNADFMARLESLVRSDEKLAQAVVLEISHADYRTLDPVISETCASLQRIGVSLGLSGLPDLRLDVGALLERRILQVRVSAAMLQQAAEQGGRIADIHPADLAELLQRKGIDLLVNDVNAEQTVLDLLDQGVPMAQGSVFGAARPVRPEILAPKAVANAPQARRAAGGEPDGSTTRNAKLPRQSFRSLLRRA
jgi:cyclic-di-GMP phosphodiesterase, flagellum assembly factor TipF